MSVHSTSICNPPEVEPVGIELVIRNHDHSFRKVSQQSAVATKLKLACDAVVATDPYRSGTEPSSQGRNEYTILLLCQGHPGIVVVPIYEI